MTRPFKIESTSSKVNSDTSTVIASKAFVYGDMSLLLSVLSLVTKFSTTLS